MNMSTRSFKMALYILLCSATFISCQRDNIDTTGSSTTKSDTVATSTLTETQQATKFAYDILSDIYFWKDSISSNLGRLSTDTTTNPSYVVSSIRYKSDKWTSLYKTTTTKTDETETTFGYDLDLYLFSNSSSDVYGIVNFVYADSPAAKAGLKRGDIILTINNNYITTSNYTDLYDATSLTLGFGALSADGKSIGNDASRSDISLNATSMYEDPVVKDTIVTTDGGNQVGYLLYTSYTLTSISKLKSEFDKFKAKGITDLVLDLRYNGGGYVTTAQALSSLIAPSTALTNKSVLLQCIWNNTYEAYWKSKNNDDKLNVRFTDAVSYTDTYNKAQSVTLSGANLNLNRLYVLVGSGTASASEATITGLKPYMSSVVLIGDQTYGKSYAGIIYDGSDYGTAINDWKLYAMVYRYADENGSSPALNGFTPNYSRSDDQFDGYQLGDKGETLFATALNLIDGKTVTTKTLTRSGITSNAHIFRKGYSQNPMQGILYDDRIKNPTLIK